MKIFKKIYHFVMNIPRNIHYSKMKRRLKNSDFSIIASDCFGSFAYHNLGQKFNSPTINLFFSKDDFFQFVSHLKEYLAAELVEVEDNSVSYPVGILTYEGRTVRVNFMHYHSFEEAKKKWDERAKRVDFSNIYIVQIVANNITQEYLDDFSSLPYEHKLLITHENDFVCDCMATHKIFSKPDYKPGEFLQYKSRFACSRYMDDIDYVSFLNRK